MKGVTDIFISKEKLALFWFSLACVFLAITGWHTYNVADTSRGSMLYVPIEKSNFYLDRSLDQHELDDVINYHTRHALETYLNRGPKGLLNRDRVPLLFSGIALEQVDLDLRENAYDFDTRRIHQMVEVGTVNVEYSLDGSVETVAMGQIVRVSVDPTSNEAVTQSIAVSARMNWIRNPNLRDSRRFPFVCTNVDYRLSNISSSEDAR
jgi:hypothetical protein